MLSNWRRKICHVEKLQISVKDLNNLSSFIEIYAVFVLNLCGEKMTNMRPATQEPRTKCSIFLNIIAYTYTAKNMCQYLYFVNK